MSPHTSRFTQATPAVRELDQPNPLKAKTVLSLLVDITPPTKLLSSVCWPLTSWHGAESPSGQGAESSSSFAAKLQTPKNRSWEQGWNRVLRTGFMSNLSFLAQTSKTFIRDLREIWANSRKNIAKYGTFKQPLRSLWHCYAEHSELIYNNRDLKI